MDSKFWGDFPCSYGCGYRVSGSAKVDEILDKSRNAPGKFCSMEGWLLRLQFGSGLRNFVLFIAIATVGNTVTQA
jgi:hypothetical protein